MASADCVIGAGVSVSSSYSRTGLANCVVAAGVGVAATRVAWGGTTAIRKVVDWLPPAHVPFSNDGKHVNPVWYRALRELFETRAGGVNGPTIPQVRQSVTDTQETVVGVVTFAQQVGQYAQGVAATVQATAEVTQDAGLSGSESIPDPPATPPEYEP